MQSETQKRFLKQAICPQMLGAEPAAHRQGQTSHQGTKAADACRTALEQNVHPDLHTLQFSYVLTASLTSYLENPVTYR